MKRLLVFGHRGARANLPENTLAGFEFAISAGADGLELDVAGTRDDLVVVSHDPVLNRSLRRSPGGPYAIREATLAEIKGWDCGSMVNRRFRKQTLVPGARIPTLDEVFSLSARGDFLFNIEIKGFPDRPHLTPPPQRFAELVLDAIRRRSLEKRVIVQSFDFRGLARDAAAGWARPAGCPIHGCAEELRFHCASG